MLNKSMIRCLFTIWFATLALFVSAADFEAGVAKACITPSYDIWMSGYASRDKPSQGKLHDLNAKALTLKDKDGNCAVLLTADLIGVSADLSDRVAQRVKKLTGIEREAIMVSASHTHSGPVLRNNLETMYDLPPEEWDKITRYTKELEDNMVKVICQSVENLQPASLYRGNGEAHFAVNRREYTLDGVKIGVNPIGPLDNDVPVMKVVDQSGSIMAIVFGYACHNTTLSIFKLSGDYAGFAQYEIEKNHPEAIAMFFIGCGADANPNPRRELEHARNYGKQLSDSVDRVLNGFMREIKGSIKTSFTTVPLPLTPAPTRAQLEEQAKDEYIYIVRRAKSLLKQLDKDGSLPETYPYSLQLWSIGNDFRWLAMAGEVVVDYSLLFKHLYGKDDIWVTGYANDVFAYIPSLRVLREGGYEANESMIYYGLHGPWKPEIEKIIVDTVAQLADEIDS